MATYEVEVENLPERFRFRLLSSDGRRTSWCGYTRPALLDEVVAVSPYYHSGSGVEIISVQRYAELTCVGEE